MPKKQEMLLNPELFKYTTSLYLNMVYYHIRLSTNVINICTIILPWCKYKYKRITMGVFNSLDIFQGRVNELFQGLNKYVCISMTY